MTILLGQLKKELDKRSISIVVFDYFTILPTVTKGNDVIFHKLRRTEDEEISVIFSSFAAARSGKF